MHFQHANEIWRDFPGLAAGVVAAEGLAPGVAAEEPIARYTDVAQTRLDAGTEGEFPEIQAWRRTFSTMGLKPTQYRCAAESLLRRLRKEGSLPRIHPLIDVCNAISVAYAVPIAVFDVAEISEYVEVRYATGDETYLTFADTTERPATGEVIFADAAGQAHARRWTNRQSGRSAVRDTTTDVLIVAEAMHDTAHADIERLTATIVDELGAIWSLSVSGAMPTASEPRVDL